jgi:nucleotide-binding universal stress UspA family protein
VSASEIEIADSAGDPPPEPAGDPAQTIERLATERGYDTIVVGGNRPGRSGHIWMDSVTAHVAANAKADVVVARRLLADDPDERH